MDRAQKQTRTRAPVVLAGALAASAGAGLLAGVITAATPFLAQNVLFLFLVAILSSSLLGGLPTGLAATAGSAISGALFVFQPGSTLRIEAGDDVLRLIALLVVGCLISVLSHALRSSRRRVALRERALRESEESYRALFNQSADALYILDRSGRVLQANEAAGTLYGVEAAWLIGKTPAELTDTERSDLDAERYRIEGAFAGEPQRFEWYGRRSDGSTIPLEISISRATYFGQDVLLAVVRDLTQRRALEEQLRQARKMEALGRLAGGVAHDFNNLLTTIRGHAALVADALEEESAVRDDLEEIEQASELAAQVTRQLLDFSRTGASKSAQPFLINPAIEGLERMLRRVIGSRIRIQLDLDPAAAAVRMDPGQLEQILLNLVVNARDAMPDGGVVTIETRLLEDVDEPGDVGDPAAGPSDSAPGRRLCLRVRDTGVGMDADTLAQIFDPFFTTKSRGEGTGLGLSTVYGIVQQHGGRVAAESQPGVGTTFTLEFRALAAESVGDGGPGLDVPEPPPESARILVVEDERPVRRLMRRVLERAGYRVTDRDTAESALRWLREKDATPELLITDLALPGRNGRELIAEVRAALPGLPVVLTTGFGDEVEAGEGGSPDPQSPAILPKPFTPAELVALVGRMLERSRDRTAA